MKSSLKQITKLAIDAYPLTERGAWVLEWPGQIVLGGSQTHWTTEVAQAIVDGTVEPIIRDRYKFSSVDLHLDLISVCLNAVCRFPV